MMAPRTMTKWEKKTLFEIIYRIALLCVCAFLLYKYGGRGIGDVPLSVLLVLGYTVFNNTREFKE